jgi:ligand-binding SRPBCC domain-containing protein
MYVLHRQQVVRTSLENAWDFIKNPRNLNEITPDDMDFVILSDLPEEMYDGLMVEYRVKIPLLGYRRWLTEIKHVRQGRSFVDEQRVGPYRLWYHTHTLEPADEGVRVIDTVHYQVPFSFLGRMAHSLFIRRMLRKIFDYREKRFVELLEESR